MAREFLISDRAPSFSDHHVHERADILVSHVIPEHQIRRVKHHRHNKHELESYVLVVWDTHHDKASTDYDLTTRVYVLPGDSSVFPSSDLPPCASKAQFFGKLQFSKRALRSFVIIDEIRMLLYAIEPIGEECLGLIVDCCDQLIDGYDKDPLFGDVQMPRLAKGLRIRQLPIKQHRSISPESPINNHQSSIYPLHFHADDTIEFHVSFGTMQWIQNVLICARTGELVLMIHPDKDEMMPQVLGLFTIRVPDYDVSLRNAKLLHLRALPISMSDTNSTDAMVGLEYTYQRYGTATGRPNAVSWWDKGRVLVVVLVSPAQDDELQIGVIRFEYNGRGTGRWIKWIKVLRVEWTIPNNPINPVFLGNRDRSLLFVFRWEQNEHHDNKYKIEHNNFGMLELTNVLHRHFDKVPNYISRAMIKTRSYNDSLHDLLELDKNAHHSLRDYTCSQHCLQDNGMLYVKIRRIEDKQDAKWTRIEISNQ